MGSVWLCSLTDDEECVLGNGRWAFTDAGVWREWLARPDAEREFATGAALRSLDGAGLVSGVDVQPERVRAVTSTALGIVEAARTRADFLITATIQPTAPAVTPYGYAILDEVDGLRGIVSEVRGAGSHEYTLVSSCKAAEGFADWLLTVGGVGAGDATSEGAMVEVMRLDEEQPQAAAVTIRAGKGSPRGASLRFGGTRRRFDPREREEVVSEIQAIIDQAIELGCRRAGVG
ncbi:MAG: hypothetical protein ACRDPH_16750 [Marmoricola sp.]